MFLQFCAKCLSVYRTATWTRGLPRLQTPCFTTAWSSCAITARIWTSWARVTALVCFALKTWDSSLWFPFMQLFVNWFRSFWKILVNYFIFRTITSDVSETFSLLRWWAVFEESWFVWFPCEQLLDAFLLIWCHVSCSVLQLCLQDKHEIFFNGMSLGIAAQKLPNDVYLVVELYGKCAGVGLSESSAGARVNSAANRLAWHAWSWKVIFSFQFFIFCGKSDWRIPISKCLKLRILLLLAMNIEGLLGQFCTTNGQFFIRAIFFPLLGWCLLLFPLIILARSW